MITKTVLPFKFEMTPKSVGNPRIEINFIFAILGIKNFVGHVLLPDSGAGYRPSLMAYQPDLKEFGNVFRRGNHTRNPQKRPDQGSAQNQLRISGSA